MQEKLRDELADALTKIYYLDIIPMFLRFLEGEQAVMTALVRLPVTMPKDICRLTGIAKNRMSAIIISLRKKEYVIVKPDDADRRKINLSLTDNGRRFIIEKIEEANSFLDKFGEAIGEEKIKDLVAIIDLAAGKMMVKEAR